MLANAEIAGRPRIAPPPHAASKSDYGADAPLSLLVNRKAGKLYVRRAFTPIFQVPIAIDNPSQPIGTHVFIARADPTRAWLAMTLDSPIREASMLEDAGRRRHVRDAPSSAPPSTAGGALARLHLAPGTAASLAALLTRGATLIVSDDGARGRETWMAQTSSP